MFEHFSVSFLTQGKLCLIELHEKEAKQVGQCSLCELIKKTQQNGIPSMFWKVVTND